MKGKYAKMDSFYDDISPILRKSQFNLTEKMIKQFELYVKLLIEWNKKINLTAILNPKDIAIKHFLDSLLVLDAYDLPENANVIDVGTGAGFPGIPLKIVRPDIKLTLLDSLNKRLTFLKSLISCLDIDADLVLSRAEDAGKKAEYREKFDVVVSRAVAPLNILLEYCAPFIKINGVFLALKGSNAPLELSNSKNAQKSLNLTLEENKKISLISENDRNIIIFKKFSEVSSIYPRNSSKISKSPL